MVVFWLDAVRLESGGDFSVDRGMGLRQLVVRIWVLGGMWVKSRSFVYTIFSRLLVAALLARRAMLSSCDVGWALGPLMDEVSAARTVEGLMSGGDPRCT